MMLGNFSYCNPTKLHFKLSDFNNKAKKGCKIIWSIQN